MNNITDEMLVSAFLEHRDKLQALKKEHEAIQYNDHAQHMVAIHNEMLRRLNDRGAKNTTTPAGTAYKTSIDNYKVVDRQAFIDYVDSHEAWDLITNHVSKEAVDSIVAATKDTPPGIKLESGIVKVNFRRS